MPMSKKRKHFSSTEKLRLLRLHLLEKEPISQICQKHYISPNVFYRWQQQLFDNGEAALARSNKGHESRTIKALERKNKELFLKLTRKDEVISEIMEAHIELKKNLGEI